MFYKSLFIFIALFVYGVLFITQVYAGDGSITSVNFRSDFSSTTCVGSGSNRVLFDAQPRPGAGNKRFTFVATSGNHGQCQIQINGNGRVAAGQTTVNTTVTSGATYTYDFSTAADGGQSTDYGITININIPNPTPTPSPTASPTFAQEQPQQSCSGIRLRWSAYAGAVKYKILYIDQADGTIVDRNILISETFKDLDSSVGLVDGHLYSFLIAALNSTNNVLAYSDDSGWKHQIFNECKPPEDFIQNRPVSVCGNIQLSWNRAAGSRPINYNIYYFDTSDRIPVNKPSLGDITSVTADESWGLIPGYYYSFIVEATNQYGSIYSDRATWSNVKWGDYTAYPDCRQPVVNLWVNDLPGEDIPVAVNQNSPATLKWMVTNATSASSRSAPTNVNWNGPILLPDNPSIGSLNLDTSIPGRYTYTLTATNGFTGASTSTSIQVNILQYPPPYFGTTGGDVHSNETIYITPP